MVPVIPFCLAICFNRAKGLVASSLRSRATTAIMVLERDAAKEGMRTVEKVAWLCSMEDRTGVPIMTDCKKWNTSVERQRPLRQKNHHYRKQTPSLRCTISSMRTITFSIATAMAGFRMRRGQKDDAAGECEAEGC